MQPLGEVKRVIVSGGSMDAVQALADGTGQGEVEQATANGSRPGRLDMAMGVLAEIKGRVGLSARQA